MNTKIWLFFILLSARVHVVDGASLFVRCEIQEHDGDMLVDTGSQISMLSEALWPLRSARSEVKEVVMGGYNDITYHKTAQFSGLNILNLAKINGVFGIFDTKALTDYFGRHIIGVLGIDILKECCIDFNGKGKWALTDPANIDYGNKSKIENIVDLNSLPAVEGKLGKIVDIFILDTGFEGEIVLAKHWESALQPYPCLGTLTRRGMNGKLATYSKYRIETFQIGHQILKGVLVEVSVDAANDGPSLLGIELMQRMKLSLNFKKRELLSAK